MKVNYVNSFLLFFLVVFLLISGCSNDLDRLMGVSPSLTLQTSSYDDLIVHYASENELPVDLVRAVVQVESGGNKDALSPQGAMGLMQLMPGTADMLGVEDPFSPEENISGGTRYLKMMINEFDDYELALAAYNAGPEAVKKYNAIPPYEETINYVNIVMDLYR